MIKLSTTSGITNFVESVEIWPSILHNDLVMNQVCQQTPQKMSEDQQETTKRILAEDLIAMVNQDKYFV